MVGIIDPPREEARASIHELRMAGIKVKMITGDHPDTASAIAKKLDRFSHQSYHRSRNRRYVR
jgi:Cation transport ATPase